MMVGMLVQVNVLDTLERFQAITSSGFEIRPNGLPKLDLLFIENFKIICKIIFIYNFFFSFGNNIQINTTRLLCPKGMGGGLNRPHLARN